MKDIPVILVCYNRPWHTLQVLKALEKHNIQNLYIFSDAPKTEKDQDSVAKIRKLIKSIYWTKPEIIYQEVNQGLAKSIVGAANYVFQRHDRLILLEDDCVPKKYYFDFIRRCLLKYEDNTKIFGINGYSVPIPDDLLANHPFDIYFYPRIGSWGWATWKRAWKYYDLDLVKLYKQAIDNNIDINQGGPDIPGMVQRFITGKLKDVWTLNWVLAVYLKNGYYIYPTASQIQNIGCDGTGLHNGASNHFDNFCDDKEIKRLPDNVIVNQDLVDNYNSFFGQPKSKPNVLGIQNASHSNVLKINDTQHIRNIRVNRDKLSIVHINTHDIAGGAAKVAWRLAEAQRNAGHDSRMVVGIKSSDTEHSSAFPIEHDPARQSYCKEHGQLFYDCQGSHKLIADPIVKSADIVHLHNLHGGYFNPFSISALSHLKPVVWTLQDMQSITGHCAHSFDCLKWQNGCQQCPNLNIEPAILVDSSSQLNEDKKLIYDHSYLRLAPASHWLGNKVKQSILKDHPVEVVHNFVDTNIFHPFPKAEVRKKYNIPASSLLVGAVAHGGALKNQWKGGNYTQYALDALSSKIPDYVFVNIGGNYETDDLRVINIPHVENEHELAQIYSALDIFMYTPVADTCPLVVLEALSCGIPVVSFDTGGIPELVRNGMDGYITEYKNVPQIVKAVEKLATNSELRAEFGRNARERATSKFDIQIISKQYEDLYLRVLEESKTRRKEVKLFPMSKIPKVVMTKAFGESEKFKIDLPGLKARQFTQSHSSSQPDYDVSIVIATKDRSQLLDQMLGSLKEAADDFDDFTYSKKSHFALFKGYDVELYGKSIDPDACDLKAYQDLLVFSFIKENIPRGSRILDIGGGKSRILNYFKNNYECWNLAKLEGLGNGPIAIDSEGYRLVKDYIGCFNKELPDNYFDFVFSISALEHVPEDDEGYFKNIRDDIDRILKPGGYSLHCFDVVMKQDSVWTNKLLPFLFKNLETAHSFIPLEELDKDSDLYCMSKQVYSKYWEHTTKRPYEEFGKPLSYNIMWRKALKFTPILGKNKQEDKHSLPKMSVITPSYNQAEFLEECIDSILSQNYPNLEYIIMDGGSTDGSVEIIKKYAKYLTYWQSRPDGGQYAAISEGFKRTSGRIMTWLNSDDKHHPDSLFKAAYIFEKYPGIEWITGRPTFWDKYGQLESICPHLPLWKREKYLQKGRGKKFIQQESTFWTATLWKKAGAKLKTDLKFAGDFELWVRFFRHAQLFTVDTLLGGFRHQPKQKINLFLDQYFQEADSVIDQEIVNIEKGIMPHMLPAPEPISFDYKGFQRSKKIIVAAVNNTNYEKAQVVLYNNIGKAYLQKGKLAYALKHFTKALKIDPYDLATVLNCGQVLTSHGLVQEARSLYRSYLQENPNDNKVIQALESLNCEKRIEGRDDVTPEYKKDLIARAEHIAMEQNQGDVESRKYLVSAIVSMYNSQRFIRGCLEDLENQTIADRLEIIVVNSGSQENEEAIVREFQQKYDNIKYIKTEQRETIYKAWNRGIKAASGKHITNANTDDRHRRDALEIMANTLESSEHVGAVYIDQIVTNHPNETFEKHHADDFIKRPDFSKELIVQRNPCGPQVMWRKKLHELIGYFKPHYEVAGDWDFWLRIVFDTDYTITHIPELLGLYYKNPQGLEIGPGKQRERLKEIDEIRNKYGRVFLAQGVDNNHNCSKSRELHDKETTYLPRHTPGSDFKKSRRILLTTSAAPSQSPFSTSEKRPPIGVGFLISVLRNAGHEVFFIDNYLQPTNFLETDWLQKNQIDFVGIYANTICFRDTLRMMHKLEHLRQTGKWKGRIIVGGPHTIVAVHTIPDFVDYVVQGEGERPILDIVEGKVTQRLVSYPRIENLDVLPMPAWDYFVKLPYNWGMNFLPETPVFTMNTSRGCPFRCQFCSVGSIWGKKYTYFSAERIVADIEYLIEHYGVKGIYFREDNFTLNKERLKKFCNLIIEKGIKVSWACESRVSNLDRDIIELMSRAGLKGFYFGVESGSQRMLNLLQKGITVEQIRNAFCWCHEFGVKAIASTIVGVPGETPSDRQETKQLLKEINPDATWFNVFVGIPNSKLYRFALDNTLYEYIDDRGLVYLQGHNDRAQRYYKGGFNACIPFEEENKDITNKPKISVLISVHNTEQFIEEALKSIYNQTYQDFEVVIVDDGSTDRTSEILLNLKDSRTFIYRNPENLGLTKSLNIGLKLCRGEYVARMDADDISHPQRFERQVKFLDENPDCLVLGCWYGRIDSDGKIWGSKEPPTEYEDTKKQLLIEACVGHGTAIVRRAALVEVGGYNEQYTYAQDYDLWLRLSEVGLIRNLDEYLYLLRSWPGNISTIKLKEQTEFAELAIRQALQRRYGNGPIDREISYGFVKRAITWFNLREYVNCINTLNNTQKVAPNITKRFKGYDLLLALAYFAIGREQQCLTCLRREIQNHNNPAAGKFLSDYFEKNLRVDVQNWCSQNSRHYNLQLVDLEKENCQQRQNNNVSEAYVSEQQSEQKGIQQSSCCKRSEPLVSVIMPAYNAAEHIAEAIESVLIQNYRNFELIIVDDGSTDRTAEIVHSFKNEPIKYFFKENGGAASARNFAFKKSNGSFIVILDSDDMITPDFIARHLQVFEQYPESDLVYCDDCIIDEMDKPIRVMSKPEYSERNALISALFRYGWAILPFRTCIRRSVFDKIGLYDEHLIMSEDYDMVRRFVSAGLVMRHLPAALYLRHLTADSLSRSFDTAKARGHFEVVRKFTETFTAEQLFPDVRWDKLPAEQKLLLAKCKTALVYLGIGEQYVASNAPDFTEVAFDLACSELNDCVKMDPKNQNLRQLSQKFKLIRAKYTEAPQQVVS